MDTKQKKTGGLRQKLMERSRNQNQNQNQNRNTPDNKTVPLLNNETVFPTMNKSPSVLSTARGAWGQDSSVLRKKLQEAPVTVTVPKPKTPITLGLTTVNGVALVDTSDNLQDALLNEVSDDEGWDEL